MSVDLGEVELLFIRASSVETFLLLATVLKRSYCLLSLELLKEQVDTKAGYKITECCFLVIMDREGECNDDKSARRTK